MSLSVGFGKIIPDPEATILTRKALAALSMPGLLVEDKGLTINNDGRFALRLKPLGGLTEDATGLACRYLSTTLTLTISLVTSNSVQDFPITVTGAVAGEAVIVSPTTTPTAEIDSWCGLVSSPDIVTVRVHVRTATSGTVAITFRVIVIGS